jgi:hypothetical protein
MKTKTSKLLAALACALVLSLSCFTAAFAATTDPAKGKEGTPDNPAQAAITKLLQMPEGTLVPKAGFTFKVTSVSVDGKAATETNMPKIGAPIAGEKAGTVTIKYDGTETGTPDSNSILTLPQEYNLFAATTWPHAGVYVYTVKETPGTYTIKDPNHEAMNYSSAEYTLNVYVKEGTNAKGEKVCYIFAIGAYATVKDDNGPVVENKIVVTPGGGEDVTLKYSQMIFTNTYVKTNGATDPEKPDPTDVDDSTLIVSKEVTGGFASKELYFDYTMTITVPSLVTPLPAYKAYVVENGAVVGSPILFVSGKENSFQLKHGQQLVFVNTPVGTSYVVTEAKSDGYEPSVTIIYAGGTPGTSTGKLGEALSTGKRLVGEAAASGKVSNSAAYLNRRDDVTPTGLNLNDLPFIGMIALALGVVAAFIVAKARKARKAASYN